MNRARLILLSGLAPSAILTSSSIASYQGITVTFNQAMAGGELRNVFRVYAVFSDPNDYLTAVAGTPTLGNINIQSRNVTDTAPGSRFYNPFGGGATAPSAYTISQLPDAAFDTFLTIGVSIADQGTGVPPDESDLTTLSPGFGGIGNVNQLNSNNAGWVTPGPVEQGRAGYAGDGDPLLRVLMMQLTVSSTSYVKGTVAVGGVNNTPEGGQSFTFGNQVFPLIPSPGGLPVFGAMALLGSRRRRQ